MKAVVTGGSGGLGYHIARELRRRGYELILISSNEHRLKRAAEELGARWYAMDLSEDYVEAGKIVEMEKPHVLVNNAGFGMYGEFQNQEWANLERMLKLNILALTHLTHSFLRVRKDGFILNISSVAACRAQKYLSAYAGSKCYVAHFTESLSREIEGVEISYLLLGPTRTGFFQRAGMPTQRFERIMLDADMVARYAVDMMFRGKRRIVPGLVYKLHCLGK